MKNESYVLYLETIVLALLKERDSAKDIAIPETANHPSLAGYSVSPFTLTGAIVEKRREKAAEPTPEPKYADLYWTPGDVLTVGGTPCHENGTPMTEEEAEGFLRHHQRHIRDRLCELGWEVIETILSGDGWKFTDEL